MNASQWTYNARIGNGPTAGSFSEQERGTAPTAVPDCCPGHGRGEAGARPGFIAREKRTRWGSGWLYPAGAGVAGRRSEEKLRPLRGCENTSDCHPEAPMFFVGAEGSQLQVLQTLTVEIVSGRAGIFDHLPGQGGLGITACFFFTTC